MRNPFQDLRLYPNILKVSRIHSPISVSSIKLNIKEKEVRIKNEQNQLLNSDLLSAPSQYILEELKNTLTSKHNYFNISDIPNKYIPNPINIDNFFPHKLTKSEAVDLIKKEFHIIADKSNYNIFIVGRVEERKGIHIILNSIKDILEKIPKAHFYFFGYHADENIISTYLLSPKDLMYEYKFTQKEQEHIHFVGHINPQLLSNVIHAGDIFPICFLEDAFSYTVLELGLSQVPMFYILKGALPEIIQEHALTFEGKNITELSKRVSELIIQHYNDPKLFIKRSENFKDYILDNFLSDPAVYNIIKIYNSYLNEKESKNNKIGTQNGIFLNSSMDFTM